MTTTVRLDRQDGVTRINLETDTGIHLLSADCRAALKTAIREIECDDDCRVVVLQSEGRTFIAGADISELKAQTRRTARKFAREGQRLAQQLADLPAVTISAIHGPCAGGGCELSLACDFRLAAASARIGLPETSLGLIPGWGGTVRSTLLLGPAVAKRIILSGELLPADEALRIGLVDAVFPDDQFRAGVEARVAQLLSRGPLAIAAAKQFIEALSQSDIDHLLRYEARVFGACYNTDEPEEGLSAFLEKRPAGWSPQEQPED